MNGDVIPLTTVPSLKVDLQEMNVMVPSNVDEMPWLKHSDHTPVDTSLMK